MKLSQRSLFVFGILIASIIITIGLLIDFKGYLGNILSEIAGMIIGVLVALSLVDRFIDMQTKKRWEKVRFLTHRSISHHLNNILLELLNHFPIPNHNIINTILACRDKPETKPIEMLTDLIEQVNGLIKQGKIDIEQINQYFSTVKWDINQIRQDLMPRVIQSSDNQDLIDILVEFDDTVQDLQNSLIIHKRLPQPDVSPNIVPLLENIREIYQHL
jgi:hypothetical protein